MEKRVLKFSSKSTFLQDRNTNTATANIYNYYKCLPSECSLATDSETFIFCKHYFSRIMFMFYICLFCRNKMVGIMLRVQLNDASDFNMSI